MKKAIFDTIVYLNARPVVANTLKRFAMSRFSKPLIRPFIRTYHIQTDQALKSVDSFTSLHDCFVRELRPGMRPIAIASDAFVSPSDAVLSIVPKLTQDSRFTIKGQDYTVAELIGSSERAQDYANGVALIFYLSPTDYHRVHSPVTGEITTSHTLGRESAPVNDLGLRFSKRPLTRNYRRVTRLQVDHRDRARHGRCAERQYDCSDTSRTTTGAWCRVRLLLVRFDCHPRLATGHRRTRTRQRT